MEDFLLEITGTPSELLNRIDTNPDALMDVENMSEADIFKLYDQHISDEERNIILQLLAVNPEDTTISDVDACDMEYLMSTRYMFPIDQDHFHVSPEFLNAYNQHVLNNQYDPITPLDNDDLEMLYSMYYLEMLSSEYDHLYLPEYLNRFSVKELKEICRIFSIKGFSKGNEDYIINLITESFMQDPYEHFENLTDDALGLISYFILEDRNSIPFDEIEGLDLEVFMINIDEENHMLYMPVDIFEHLVDYFEFKGINPLDQVDPDLREYYEDLQKVEQINAITKGIPDDVEDALAAFSQIGQDEELREFVMELIDANEEDSDDQLGQVIAQIMDGKVQTKEQLEKVFENTTPEQLESKNNVIDLNQYRNK